MNNEELDCEVVFEGKQKNYAFKSKDLAKALKYMKEHNWRVVAIRTPWCWLSVLEEDVAKNAIEFFK